MQTTSKSALSRGLFDAFAKYLSTTLCLLHRAHMPPASATPESYRVEEIAYPSRTIAFQAAAMITSIVDTLQAHDELVYAPAFM